MTAEQAAARLDNKLRRYPWYISAGVGVADPDQGDAIFVYVKSSRHRELNSLRDGWLGYPVVVRSTGTVRALSPGRFQALVS